MISDHVVKNGFKEVNIDNNKYKFFWDIIEVPNSGHNCAYVYIPVNILQNQNKLEELQYIVHVHGDLTYNEDVDINDDDYLYKKENNICVIIGWDYIHFNDYHQSMNPEGEIHSLEEIQEECISCIDKIAAFLNNQTKE